MLDQFHYLISNMIFHFYFYSIFFNYLKVQAELVRNDYDFDRTLDVLFALNDKKNLKFSISASPELPGSPMQ